MRATNQVTGCQSENPSSASLFHPKHVGEHMIALSNYGRTLVNVKTLYS